MSKKLKEKYEKACNIKDKALCLVEEQLEGDLSQVDAKELGEVADIAKDMAELIELCAEAEYYYKVVEAMEESSDEEKSEYLGKYIPEYRGKFYTEYPIRRDWKDDIRNSVYNPNDERFYDRMYYSGMTPNKDTIDPIRDAREGKSGLTRKTYIELDEMGADKLKKNEEMKLYLRDLTEDIGEMIQHATPEDKATLKQTLANFINKMS